MNLSSLIEAALRTLLAALAVGAGLRLLRVSNVLAQKKAWMLVLGAALLMPLVMRWHWLSASAPIRVPAYPWAQRVDSRPVVEAVAPVSFTAHAVLPKADLAPLPAEHFAAPASTPSAVSAPVPAKAAARSISITTLLRFLYLGVCALLLARLLYGLAATAWLWARAKPVSLALDSDLPVGLRLRSSRRIASPVALASGVVLPADFAQWDRQKLRVVLAHEHAHILQHDFHLQTLAGLHAALFWFSPLAWWLKRKLSDLGEAVSDRAGLEAAASRSSYAQILLEFAAQPRPTPSLGVAMAHSSNLSNRIERFLNDSRFHQAFAGSRRRAFLAVLLAPVAIFAFTALIRVEAAGQPVVKATAAQPVLLAQASQSTGQATTDLVPPPPPPVSDSQLSPLPPPPPSLALAPPPPPPIPNGSHDRSFGPGYSYSANGDAYAFVPGPGNHFSYSGNWDKDTQALIDKARKQAHGKFLWFKQNGKYYFLDDPTAVAPIEDMYKPMEELGKKQEELGRQQEVLGKQMEEVGRKMKEATLPTPEMSKEIGELEKQLAKLKAMQGKTMTTEDWADLQSKMGDLQGKLGSIQGEIGSLQGSFGGEMGKLGGQMGGLGGKMGELGAEQGILALETDRKIKAIIDKALKEGKARPIQ